MSYKKLLDILSSNYNVAKGLPEDKQKEYVRQMINGYKADAESRADWLEKNEVATKLLNSQEDGVKRTFPFKNPCDVILPMLAPAAISFASRLIPHIKQNGKTVKHVVFGEDADGVLNQKAERRSEYLNYRLLHESSTWSLEMHKVLMIVGTWGICFKQVYRDFVEQRNSSDIIHPRDCIINYQTQSLDKCARYTIRNYYSENDLVSRMHAGHFLDIDLEKLTSNDNEYRENASDDDFPVYEILQQYCLLDLDEDGYYEPYIGIFHESSETLFAIFPAYKIEDIHLNDETDEIIKIKRTPGIVPYFGIDNPDGGFYSIGLNSLLYNLNKGANTVFRQLADAGTLANQQAGFITRSVRPQERSLQFDMGEFKVVDAPPNVDLKSQIFQLPFNEPSQVLFQLLGLLMETSKEVGFITEILTGETSGQNVPATTMLALVEQGTRAFKPVVEKLNLSLKTEFELHTKLIVEYDSDEEYKKFHNLSAVTGSLKDYDYKDTYLKIEPVADPTMASEAHKYAQLQAISQLLDKGVIPNPMEAAKYYLKGLQIPDNLIDAFMQPPPGADKPDPKLEKIKADQVKHEERLEFDREKLQQEKELAHLKQIVEELKLTIESVVSQAEINKLEVDARMEERQLGYADEEISIKERLADYQESKLALEDRKLDIQERNIKRDSKE